MARLKQGNYQTINIDEAITDFVELPNGNLALGMDYQYGAISIYDKNFLLIKNNVEIVNDVWNGSIISMTTNNKDKIFILSEQAYGYIIMIDMQFNYLNSCCIADSLDDILEYDSSDGDPPDSFEDIYYHDKLLYLCNIYQGKWKSCFVRFQVDDSSGDSKISFHSRLYLDFVPLQIQILNNLAFIIYREKDCRYNNEYTININDNDDEYLKIYDLPNFQLKYKYSYSSIIINHRNENLHKIVIKRELLNICVHENILFVLCDSGKRIDCYSKHGLLIEKIDVSSLNLESKFCKKTNSLSSRMNIFLGIHQNKLVIYSNDKKLIII
jgi:hypothetical protein